MAEELVRDRLGGQGRHRQDGAHKCGGELVVSSMAKQLALWSGFDVCCCVIGVEGLTGTFYCKGPSRWWQKRPMCPIVAFSSLSRSWAVGGLGSWQQVKGGRTPVSSIWALGMTTGTLPYPLRKVAGLHACNYMHLSIFVVCIGWLLWVL